MLDPVRAVRSSAGVDPDAKLKLSKSWSTKEPLTVVSAHSTQLEQELPDREALVNIEGLCADYSKRFRS